MPSYLVGHVAPAPPSVALNQQQGAVEIGRLRPRRKTAPKSTKLINGLVLVEAESPTKAVELAAAKTPGKYVVFAVKERSVETVVVK